MRIDYVPLCGFVKRRDTLWGEADSGFAASITKAASKQTYYTIRFLVDRERVQNAYRAYAYFRWMDDQLDQKLIEQRRRIDFLERQRELVNRCYRGETADDLFPQEQLLVSLVASDAAENSGLQAYIRNMMSVMAFDTCRRGRLISQAELDAYTHHLAVGVTEALHYFIGHGDPAPKSEARYAAVTGAHITHMLRDSIEDAAMGYLNIPCEFVSAQRIDPCDTQSPAYRLWVKHRVQLAQNAFAAGKRYLAQIKSGRCRLAGFAYIARFEYVLDAIEKANYYLRPEYSERHTLHGALRMGWSAFSMFALPLPPTRGQS